MNRQSFTRLESSRTIDELLSLSDRRHPPNWLLTYIDVFVLIVMLVVTLISLSSFEPVPDSTGQPTVAVTAKPKSRKPVATKPEPIPAAPEIQAALPGLSEPAPTATDQPTLTTTAPEQSVDAVVAEQLIQPEQDTEDEESAAASAAPSASERPALNTTDRDQPVMPASAEEAPEAERETEEAIPPAERGTATEGGAAEADLQQQLDRQLEQLGLSDSINMTITLGYAQLEIQDNILYQSSAATLTESGRQLLTKLTPLLKQAKGLIYIEGHTDDRPIQTARFPSNWELGAARATSVLHFLASQQIDANRMRAITYADTKPIADNASEQGRRKNRRVNIVIKVSDSEQ